VLRSQGTRRASQAYLATFAPDLVGRLEPFEGTRTYTGSGAAFVAS
jgi:hypothetical protein